MSQEDQLPEWQSKPPPAAPSSTLRISPRRILRDAMAGLRARFVDIMALGAILVLVPGVLLAFHTGDADTAMLWMILANLPVLVFEGAAIRLMHGALIGAPAISAGDALRLGLSRLSQLFSIFALTFSPILLAVAGLSLLGQTALLAASPVLAVAALTLNLLLLVAPALVMIEGIPAFPAMRLSVELTRGHRWRLAPVVLVIGLLSALTLGVTFGAQFVVGLFAAKDVAERVGDFVVQPLITLAVEPLGAALVTAAYLQLRRGGAEPSLGKAS